MCLAILEKHKNWRKERKPCFLSDLPFVVVVFLLHSHFNGNGGLRIGPASDRDPSWLPCSTKSRGVSANTAAHTASMVTAMRSTNGTRERMATGRFQQQKNAIKTITMPTTTTTRTTTKTTPTQNINNGNEHQIKATLTASFENKQKIFFFTLVCLATLDKTQKIEI